MHLSRGWGGFLVGLFSEVQFGNDFLVLLLICVVEEIEQAAALADHSQQTDTRNVVFLVVGKVLGQVIDASSQDCDLDRGATGVIGVQFKRCGCGEF